MISTRVMDVKLRETAEGIGEDSTGKKKSKFKTFKKLFGKKKRKESPSSTGSSAWKQSQVKNEVIVAETGPVGYDSEDELEDSRGTLGSRALSHDSIFIPESGQDPTRPVRVFSQENVCDRIKALQLKIQCNVKMGPPPPGGLPVKRGDDTGMSSEDDGLPRSPPEMSLLHEVAPSTTIKVSLTPSPRVSPRLLTPDHLFCRQMSEASVLPRTSRSSLAPVADFDYPPEFSSCLDNSAAKHKLLVKPRNQRSSKMRRLSSRAQSESLSYLLDPDEDYEEKPVLRVSPPDKATSRQQDRWSEPGALGAMLHSEGPRARRARLQHSPALRISGDEESTSGDQPPSRPTTPEPPAPCSDPTSLQEGRLYPLSEPDTQPRSLRSTCPAMGDTSDTVGSQTSPCAPEEVEPSFTSAAEPPTGPEGLDPGVWQEAEPRLERAPKAAPEAPSPRPQVPRSCLKHKAMALSPRLSPTPPIPLEEPSPGPLDSETNPPGALKIEQVETPQGAPNTEKMDTTQETPKTEQVEHCQGILKTEQAETPCVTPKIDQVVIPQSPPKTKQVETPEGTLQTEQVELTQGARKTEQLETLQSTPMTEQVETPLGTLKIEQVESPDVNLKTKQVEILQRIPKTEQVEIPQENPKIEQVETPQENPKTEQVETPLGILKIELVESPNVNLKTEQVEILQRTPKTEQVEISQETPKTEQVGVLQGTCEIEQVETPQGTLKTEQMRTTQGTPEQMAPALEVDTYEPRVPRFSIASSRLPPPRVPSHSPCIRVPLGRSGPAWKSEAALDNLQEFPGTQRGLPRTAPERGPADLGQPAGAGLCTSPRDAAAPLEPPGSEDRSPFPVKLRSTSLSLRHRDAAAPGLRGPKRHSAEVRPERTGLALPSRDKCPSGAAPAPSRGTRSPNNQRQVPGKGRPPEPPAAKPPLPRKPLLQTLTLQPMLAPPDADAHPGELEREVSGPGPRKEKKQQQPHRGAEKAQAYAASGPGADSQPAPPWITITRHKRRGTPDLTLEQKDRPGTRTLISETGKPVKEPMKQIDFVRSKSFLITPAKPSRDQDRGQGTKLHLQEGLQRGISLSHQNLAQAATMTEKELHQLKRASYTSADQPSWMELARKKSQAWSDMPQIIK